jgi:hypothetical protein
MSDGKEFREVLLRRLESLIERVVLRVLAGLLLPDSPPRAPRLTGTFTQGDPAMSSTVLTATLPTLRTDGTALAPTDIASITFQKVPAGATAGTILTTNGASGGAGLAPEQISFTDTSAAVGDVYTAFVTDVEGNVGPPSNTFTNAAVSPPPALAPPAAPGLSGTFSP